MFVKLLITGLSIGSVYSLMGIGYSLLYKSSGQMSFVQGDLLTLGAFLGYTFCKLLNLPFWAAILLTMLVAFLVGFLIERGIIRKLTRKKVSGIYLILATIALSYIIQTGAQAIWGSITLYYPSLFKKATVKILGAKLMPEYLLCFGVSAVCMLILHYFMNRTSLGTKMRAASMDAAAAESCGIDVSLMTGLSWAIAAGLSAVGGALVGPMYGVYTTLGGSIGKKGFAGAVMGGYGHIYGAMIGGLLLGVTETLVASYVSSSYKNMISYVILLLFLFIKPTGIFNEKAIQDV